MSTLESVKPPECIRADQEAYAHALDQVLNQGASWWDVVPELRRAYAENLRTWRPSQWRQVERARRARQ